MKLISTFMLLAFAGSVAISQPVPGKILLGGNFGINTGTQVGNSDHSETTFDVFPMIGFITGTKMAFGARVGYTYQKLKIEDEKITYSAFGLSPFYRYYFISEKGGIFMEAMVSSQFGVEKSEYYDGWLSETVTEKTKVTSIAIGISPGVYYYITPGISLEAKFGWFGFSDIILKDEDDDKISQESFELSLNPQSISFGVTFTL
jgi:outer membrane immunogenic protein